MEKKPEIVITSIPVHYWSYYQWFILGLYELEKKGLIKLKFKTDFITKISTLTDNKYLLFLRRYIKRKPYCNLDGYFLYNGRKSTFTIDCDDSPYMYSGKRLESCSVYFKMQCPLDFPQEGFHITDKVIAPWSDIEHVDSSLGILDWGERKSCTQLLDNLNKVKPLMIGPRRLSRGNSYKSLKKAYDKYFSDRSTEKTKKIMCYFGNSEGPKPSENVKAIDWESESDIMGVYKDVVQHPNQKRYIVSNFLKSNNQGRTDARIITESYSDSGIIEHPELVIPLQDFCKHISQFEYNVNVSGYRMSIPNRFIESFIVGTAIFTDKLKVRWYKPFNEEIFETTEMGYLPEDEVDWEKVENDIKSLPITIPEKIISNYENKWSPCAVANYILEELKKCNK